MYARFFVNQSVWQARNVGITWHRDLYSVVHKPVRIRMHTSELRPKAYVIVVKQPLDHRRDIMHDADVGCRWPVALLDTGRPCSDCGGNNYSENSGSRVSCSVGFGRPPREANPPTAAHRMSRSYRSTDGVLPSLRQVIVETTSTRCDVAALRQSAENNSPMRHAARGGRRLRQSRNASDLARFVACTRHAAMPCGVLTHQQPQQQQLQQRRCPTSATSLSGSCLSVGRSVLFRLLHGMLHCCCCCCCLHATELNNCFYMHNTTQDNQRRKQRVWEWGRGGMLWRGLP